MRGFGWLLAIPLVVTGCALDGASTGEPTGSVSSATLGDSMPYFADASLCTSGITVGAFLTHMQVNAVGGGRFFSSASTAVAAMKAAIQNPNWDLTQQEVAMQLVAQSIDANGPQQVFFFSEFDASKDGCFNMTSRSSTHFFFYFSTYSAASQEAALYDQTSASPFVTDTWVAFDPPKAQ
jgi:hypothetical protein